MSHSIRVAHVTTVDLTMRFLLLRQLRRLRDEGYEVTAISAPGSWVADLEAEGIRHIPWQHATRSWNLGSDIRAFGELLSIFRRERFDVVHTHNPKPGIMGRVAARIARIPCVVNTVHGFYATPEDRAMKRLPVIAMERLAALFSHLELYQSKEDLEWARRTRVVSSSKGILLGNGVDLSHFDPSAVPPLRLAQLRDELGIPEGVPVVGMVGRLVAEKGYRELVEAGQVVKATIPAVRFLVVGDSDPDKSDSLSRDEVEQAGEHFVMAGWRSDIRELLALMDIFVLPSWREGVPRSAIEAAAMGKPLILTNIRGCREVVRAGVEGILVPPREPKPLAEAILRLISDEELRRRLGAAARARALKRFDEEEVVNLVLSLYQRLLGTRRVSTRSRRSSAGTTR